MSSNGKNGSYNNANDSWSNYRSGDRGSAQNSSRYGTSASTEQRSSPFGAAGPKGGTDRYGGGAQSSNAWGTTGPTGQRESSFGAAGPAGGDRYGGGSAPSRPSPFGAAGPAGGPPSR